MERDRLAALFQAEFAMCKVSAGETMVVLSDPATRPAYITAAFAAARELGAQVFQIGVPLVPSWQTVGVTPLKGLTAAVEAMKAANIVVAFHIVLFTRELREIMQAGTRVLMVIDHPDDLERLFPTPALRRAVEAAGRRLAATREMRITSEAGTDLTVKTGEYPVMIQYGYTDIPGRFDHWGAGHVHTFPNEGSAEGTAIVNVGDMVVLPFYRYVQDPMKLTISDGYIRKIEGGLDATLMRDWLESWHDPEGFAISHLGWGLHPKAQWNCMALYGAERCLAHGRAFAGNFLFSTGPNTQGGGTRTTPGHYDVPMRACSIYLDDELVIDRGKIVVEDMQTM